MSDPPRAKMFLLHSPLFQESTLMSMSTVTRRNFLQSAAAAMVCGAAALKSGKLMASPFGLPIGLQLYSVREMIAKDYEGTLKHIAALGYKDVEAAGYFGHSVEQVKQAMQGAGLNLVSAHYSL